MFYHTKHYYAFSAPEKRAPSASVWTFAQHRRPERGPRGAFSKRPLRTKPFIAQNETGTNRESMPSDRLTKKSPQVPPAASFDILGGCSCYAPKMAGGMRPFF